MVIAALVVFAALLVAWLLAPVDSYVAQSAGESAVAPEPESEPLAQVA
jgi:hypothetical protein